MKRDPGAGLLGRWSECELLDQVLDDARAGRSRVLVLHGEAGVGKTSLLDYVASSASGCRVVRSAGVEAEMDLAFASLHQLCASMLEGVDRLPAPQRDALGTAFGLIAGEAADRFLVGLAVLNLIADAAERQPLVCLIDDAQWLDRVSAQLLAFVARRLLAEHVAMVFAVRDPMATTELDRLPHRMIGGLGNDDARRLLDSASPGPLDERVRDRIVAETHGNPLALLELPRGLTAAELAGGFALPATRPLSGQIEQSFLNRVQALPTDTRRLLLVAAADPVGDGVVLRRAADRLGIGAEAEAPAEADGLIEFGTHVRFRHPLVRSAAYRSGSLAERQGAHRALAESTDPVLDPDRRAWHLAHAAREFDEEVAAELERSAERAQRRGGVAAAAAFLERSAQLTADPSRRGRRALAAAQAKLEAGDHDAADALLAAAEVTRLDAAHQALGARLRAQIVFSRRRGSDAVPLLLDAARRLEGIDEPLSRETYLEALGAAVFSGRLSRPDRRDVAAAARQMGPRSSSRRPIDHLLDGLVTRFTEGYVSSVPELHGALDELRRDTSDSVDGTARWLWLAWLVAGDLWADELWEQLAMRAVRLARDTGRLGQVPIALTYLAGVHVHAGDFQVASSLLDEADSINDAIGGAPLRATAVVLLAWRGDEEHLSSVLAAGVPNALERGEGRAIGLQGFVKALLYNGLGRYHDALVAAQEACEFDDVGVTGFGLVELVEAAVREGADDLAAQGLRRLEQRAGAAGTEWALGMLARSRALVSTGDEADSLYRESIDRLARCRIAVHLARAHLLYGEWLRREQRRVDARDHLRTAYEMLHRFGVDAFAERARRELVATGETARERVSGVQHALTPQEAQIARLAADGHTNPEIGSELFISPRTVEYHLSKVFTKLGLRTRRELVHALAQLSR
ncbi:MAG: AAA family ATPase [Ilumatobacteraceae bacterium]